jgi:hypothetical protein
MKRLIRFLSSIFRRRARDDFTALLLADLGLPR